MLLHVELAADEVEDGQLAVEDTRVVLGQREALLRELLRLLAVLALHVQLNLQRVDVEQQTGLLGVLAAVGQLARLLELGQDLVELLRVEALVEHLLRELEAGLGPQVLVLGGLHRGQGLAVELERELGLRGGSCGDGVEDLLDALEEIVLRDVVGLGVVREQLVEALHEALLVAQLEGEADDALEGLE